jgi:lipopolysaccharide transport system permease protein
VTLGIVNFFSRDLTQVLAVVLQIWFWLTPIVYTRAMPPESFRWIFSLNPLVPFVEIYQRALLYGSWPDFPALAWPALIGGLLFASAFMLFRRAGPEIVDAL